VRIAFLVHELGRSGGAETIRAYARGLEERRGFEVDLVSTDSNADAGGAVLRGEPYDVAIATWWATAGHLWRVRAERRAVFLQSVESRFYEERHFFERLAAEEVLALPVAYVTVAHWIRDLLGELRPDAACDVVLGGIDKSTFAPRPRPETTGGPLRVLAEGQPSMWFKGVRDAVASVRAMREPAELTVVAGQPEDAGDLDGARVVGGLTAPQMADLYAEHDVVVKLSRVESLGLGPIEAAHVGTPAVVTPYTGHDEHVVHGRNGFVVGMDDVPGTARALDRLALDPDLRRRLSEGALETAREWPSAADAVERFAAALERIAESPAPDPEPALAALALAGRRRLELTREHVRQSEAELQHAEGMRDWFRHAHEEACRHVEELGAAMRDLDALLKDKDRLIEDIRSERAYRAAVAMRRVLLRRDA
jgi:glycosyltransferase involved in cell wall biosynthesis